MSGVRSMLARVQRLEEARSSVSPIARAYGSFDAFAAECEAGMETGRLDRADFSVVLHCLRRWENEGAWAAWQHDRTWQLGSTR